MKKFLVYKIGFSFMDVAEFDELSDAKNYRDRLIKYGYNAIIFVRIDFCDDMIDEK